ncbi:unnamed protein product [Brugia pahangi]|uniref:Gastrula zinc finger protein XlCGF26.1-like n=1 Tax=Brugia pahangi TaxID=6280 RepID=A0A158PSG5_BRUPA|nr:unnamed protein product [Brugia pahangi]
MRIHCEVAQTDQTEPLDLSISKGKEKGDGLQGLSMERENEEEIGLQVFQTKALDLSASKVKEEGNKLEGLSVEGVDDERIKPRRQLVPIETVMEVMELSKKERRAGRKQHCNICQKEVKNNMNKHMLIHTGEKPFSCSICKKNFTQFGDVKRHMMIHTGEKPFSCSICRKSFTQKHILQSHMAVIYHVGIFITTSAAVFFQVAQTDQTEPLDLSISKAKEKRDGLQGLSMERENEEEIGLQNWQQIILIDMHFIYLFFVVFQLSNIQTTVAQTEQTEPLDLSISKVKEKGDGSQGLSMEGASGERIRPRQQLVPIKTLMEVVELSKQEGRTTKKHRCDICRREVANIKTHMKTHIGEKTHSCPLCKRNFTQLGDMKKHMTTHTGEKLYSCSLCKKNFSRSDSMKKHMMTHTGKKPYSCSICKKNFGDLSNMKRHKTTHTGEKLYSCSICKKNFTRSNSMKAHMVIHAGEKLYSCSICKKNFTQFDNMKTHMVILTGEKPYNCLICGKSYTQKHSLQTHMVTHDINTLVYHCTVCKDFQVAKSRNST